MNKNFCYLSGVSKGRSIGGLLGLVVLTLLETALPIYGANLYQKEVKCGDQKCGDFEITNYSTFEEKNSNQSSKFWIGGVNIKGKFAPQKNNDFHYIQSLKMNTDNRRWFNDTSVPLPTPFLDPPPGGYQVRDDANSPQFIQPQPFDYLPWYDQGKEFPNFSDMPSDYLLTAKNIGKDVEWLFETWIVCVIDKNVINNEMAKDDTYKVAPLLGFQWGFKIIYKDAGTIGMDDPADFTVEQITFGQNKDSINFLTTPSADWDKATSAATKYGTGAKEDFWNITKGNCKDCRKVPGAKVPEPSSLLSLFVIGAVVSLIKSQKKDSH